MINSPPERAYRDITSSKSENLMCEPRSHVR